MRFLFFNYEYPPIGGGGGTCSRYLARELVRLGHEVTVLTAHFGSLPLEEVQDGVRIRRIRCGRSSASRCTPWEMIRYVLTALWDSWFSKPTPMPDVLVSFHSIPSGIPPWLLSRRWRVPHIVLFQGGDVPGWLPGELKQMHRFSLWVNRMIVHGSAAALANSDGLRDLAQKSFPRKKIGVLYGGADPEEYQPLPRPEEEEDRPVRFLFCGRLTTQKGLEVALAALAEMQAQEPERPWSLDVVGDGPLRKHFEETARILDIGKKVTFHGFLSREETRRRYQGADVFIFPSRFEGMPNVVLEAMACGLPILGTRIAGTEQLVIPERNGLLVDVDDVPALTAACLRLLRDEDLRWRMGDSGRALVLERWTWTARAGELVAICGEFTKCR